MKSISEYIASIILATITIVGASIAYYSLHNSIDSISRVSENAYSKAMISLVDVDDKYVYLYNFGEESLAIYSPSIEIYFNNTWITSTLVPSNTLFRVSLDPGVNAIVLKTDHGVVVIKL